MKKKLVNAVVAAIMVISALSMEMTAYAGGTFSGQGNKKQEEAPAAPAPEAPTPAAPAPAAPVVQKRLVREQDYNADGTRGGRIEYSYDSQGNKTEEVHYDSNASVSYWYEYSYDSQGNMTKSVNYGSDGSVSNLYEYSYDSQGNMTKELIYNGDGVIIPDGWTEYSYDDQGRVIQMWLVDWRKYVYSYDGQGNRTKEVIYDSGSVNGWTEYSYDGQGNQIKSVSYDSKGSVSNRTEYSYDVRGNQIKSVSYDSKGSVSSLYVYGYDSEGNRTKYIRHGRYGSLSGWTDYIYEEEGQMSVEDIEAKEELEQILLTFWFGGMRNYDCTSGQNGDLLKNMLSTPSCYAGYYYPYNTGTYSWDSKDPLGRWSSYASENAMQVDWVLRNIFNCPEAEIAAMKAPILAGSDQDRYYLDGYYYYGMFGIGSLDYIQIESIQRKGDKYQVIWSHYLDNGPVDSYYSAVVERKIIDGEAYWSLYSQVEISSLGGGDDAWKKAYLDYIPTTYRHDSWSGDGTGYALIYLDDDDIPELVWGGLGIAEGLWLIYYSNGKVEEQFIGMYSSSYIERRNLLHAPYGNQGNYSNTVYSMINGKMTEIAGGSFGIGPDNTQSFDESDYTYNWEGQSVTKDGYYAELKKVYNEDLATHEFSVGGYSTGTYEYTYEQVINAISNW